MLVVTCQPEPLLSPEDILDCAHIAIITATGNDITVVMPSLFLSLAIRSYSSSSLFET